MPTIYTASAPGKLILCGEHSVVYGQPAIAVPIFAVRAQATAEPAAPAAGLTIESAEYDERWSLDDDAPLPALLRRALEQFNSVEPDVTLRLTSNIPIAGGMGSGAAVATALVRALAAVVGQQLAPEGLSALVYESERVFHGTPSGIDNSVVAYEQPIWFQRRPSGPPLIEPVQVGAALHLVVGDTGVRSETRGSVGDVRRRWQADPEPYERCFAAVGELVRQVRAALEQGDLPLLGRLLDLNQSRLEWLRLSSPELDRLIAAAREAGALGAKLSGGGWGGAMLALAHDAAAAQSIAAALAAAGAARVIVTRLDATSPQPVTRNSQPVTLSSQLATPSPKPEARNLKLPSNTLDAAVLVVTHNHAAHIEACLRSLLALDPAPREIVVVDNASQDGTAALVQRSFPSLPLLEPGANLGFAGGNRLAAERCDARYLVLANPDLIVRQDWLAALLAPLEERATAGISGGKLLFPDGRTLQHAGGELRLPRALGHHRGHGEVDSGQYERLEPVDYVTGAALACKREVWDQLGGLDEGFFPAYYEEVDLCVRARAAGWEVVYAPGAVAQHVESAGLGRHSAAFYRFFHRNRLRFLFKHHDLEWLVATWLSAELAYLRSVAEDEEIDALTTVYLAYQHAAACGGREADLAAVRPAAEGTERGGETELQWVTRRLQESAPLRYRPAGSRWPLLNGLRRLLSRLLIADDLLPVVQQQSTLNAAITEAIAALGRQRRAADAAIVLQGMLLARWLRERVVASSD